jgi:hypothetical protein
LLSALSGLKIRLAEEKSQFFFGKAVHIHNIGWGEVFYPEDGSDPVMAVPGL